MSVRRDNRTAGGVGPGGPHAKLNHDRHNHELLKRLSTHATHAPKKQPAHAMPGKAPPTEGVTSPGGRAGPRGSSKGRVEAGPKSFLRPTSSSAMKAAGNVTHTTPATRRLDSNRRPHQTAARKAVVGDGLARRAHARAAHTDKEEKDSFEAKQQEDSLPETPDKDRRYTPPPTPTPDPPTPATPSSTPATLTPTPTPSTLVTSSPKVVPPDPSSPSPAPLSPTSATTGPKPPSPASLPRQTPPTPTQGTDCRQEPKAQSSTQPCARPASGRGGDVGLEALCPPSREAVLRGVRARVGDGRRAGGVDADKDVCEAAAEDEDEEFYRVRVKTRLVSYDNSTLVIRNTSRAGDTVSPDAAPHPQPDLQTVPTTVSDAPQDHHPVASPDQHLQRDPDPHSEASPTQPTLPTPLVSPSAVAAAPPDVENASPTHTLPVLAQPHTHAGARFGAGAGMKRRLTLLVNRGRSFLAEVYSATQSRLEHYVKSEGAPRPGPPHHHDASPPPLHVEINPIWLLQHAPQAQWVSRQGGEEAGVPFTPLHTPEDDGGTSWAAHEDAAVKGEPEEGVGVDAGMEVGVSVQVDEEWIKKNILCTCRCRLPPATRDKEVEEGKKKPEEQDIKEEENNEEEEEVAEVERQQDKDGEEDEEERVRGGEEEKEEEDLCYCSCHEGTDGAGLPHLPTEIQELLDADHARMWWTITGNFGNILPIDWSKTYTRQQYLPVLNLNEMKEGSGGGAEEGEGGTEKNAGDDGAGEEEEEEVAQDLDLHHLILNGLTAEPVKSAEEVIQEIDDIMQEGSSSEDEGVEESTSSGENMQDPPTRPCPPHLYHDKLKNMSVPELNEALMELELVIRQYSETLITQLALRDELEYEKELKNSFISLLLQVQNKRRNFNVEKKKQKKVGPNGTDPKYLTTVIPYDVGHGPPHNPTLQILIKILTAINEDSPTVPTLLTDYILKVAKK